MDVRIITYAQALNEALSQIMETDPRTVLIGQGVTSPWYVGSTTVGLVDRFGRERVIDTPVSENGMTGVGIGAALAGLRPILVYPRMDFMLYAMDQIGNHAANWYYMFGGQLSVPITIWGIVNRGGEQAAQHSQSLEAVFAHIPGLKVVMPSTPYDAKGLLISSMRDDNPVVYVDDRWLYSTEGEVPEEIYTVSIGRGVIRREGEDVTVISVSYMVHKALEAADILAKDGVQVEVIDLRSLKPLDQGILVDSVKKTGRAVVATGSWRMYGVAAEICALVGEQCFRYLKSPVRRVCLPDAPAPASSSLESAYYPRADTIVSAVKELLGYE